MKSLYESLLDDGVFSDIETTIISDWMDTYCSGGYKTKTLKDGSLKISGTLIIKNAKDIPPIRISEINGTMSIENCGMKSLADIFAGKYAWIKGDLSITNCKNLEDVSDLPMSIDGDVSIVGCQSLRSLEGVDCMARGVSIMKCGKRFGKATVQKCFKIARRIYCSEEEVEANICEAFSDPVLIRMWEQMKNLKLRYDTKDLFGRNLALDQITASCRNSYDMSDGEKDMLKDARSVLNGKSLGFIVTESYDGQFMHLYNNQNFCYILYKKPEYPNTKPLRVNEVLGYLSSSAERMIDIQFVHVYHLDSIESTWKKRSDRIETRKGMITNDPETLKQILRDQRDRYAKAVRQIKALRESGKYKEWLDKVEAVMNRFSTFMNKYIRDPKWGDSVRFSAEEVFDSIRQGYRRERRYQRYGVIYAFQLWSRNVVKTAVGQGDTWTDTSTDELEDALDWADQALKAVGL